MLQQLVQSFRDLQLTIVTAVPRILVGLVVLVVLLVLAKVIERVLRAALVRLRFDSLLEQTGVDKVLHRLGIRQSLNVVLPRLAYFLLLFLFARTAADAVGLTALSEAIAAMFAYLPNVLAAVLVVVVGTSVSQFAGETTARAAGESGIEFARQLGSLVSGLVLFVVAVMAIGQLRFDTDMVRIVTICTLSGLALAFGISIGLGTRDITRTCSRVSMRGRSSGPGIRSRFAGTGACCGRLRPPRRSSIRRRDSSRWPTACSWTRRSGSKQRPVFFTVRRSRRNTVGAHVRTPRRRTRHTRWPRTCRCGRESARRPLFRSTARYEDCADRARNESHLERPVRAS
jgi:hypothetical protein